MSVNISEVHLLDVPLENDYLHTLYFSSKSEQASYFSSRKQKSYTDFSYQRKDNIIRVPAHYDSLLGCNYVMYKNSYYSSKWWYAFITDMKYVDDGRTDITIETDVMQTWMFDYTLKPSFVEREHVTDDSIGKHTLPEQLELGGYIVNEVNPNNSLNNHGIIIASSVDLNKDNFPGCGGDYYNGIYSGIKYYSVDRDEANKIISDLAEAGKSDAIVSIFMSPSIFVKTNGGTPGTYSEVTQEFQSVQTNWVNALGSNDKENTKPKTLNGYKPINNKLLTYPFTYMLMSNNNGGSAVYKYELFNTPDEPEVCKFFIESSITPGFSIQIRPRYYNGSDLNSVERLTLGKLPVCAWNTDSYTNWLTQNAVNIPLSIGSSLVQTGIGIAGVALAPTTGGISAVAGAASVASGVTGIAASVSEIYQHSLQPPQLEGSINSGDVAFSTGLTTFTAYKMTIKEEYARVIDQYFNMYGYKVNSVKVPNKNHRKNYWYTKCIDVNIDGAIPSVDMKKIKQCYNQGITFWKSARNIQDYTIDNSIS